MWQFPPNLAHTSRRDDAEASLPNVAMPASSKLSRTTVTGAAVRLKVKVTPGASSSRVVGWLGETLKVAVSEPPEKGKANAAVEALICQTLNLPNRAVRIVSGRHSQRKVVEIYGLSRAEVFQRLASRTA